MYSVVLDKTHSYIISSEDGMSFEDSCKEIIDYCEYCGYETQKELWEQNLERGERMHMV